VQQVEPAVELLELVNRARDKPLALRFLVKAIATGAAVFELRHKNQNARE
jgi:hypothetical protein